MSYATGRRTISIPEVKNKTGKYSNEAIDRVAKVNDMFTKMHGSITAGKASAPDEAKLMTAVGVKETALKDTPRGYLYHFDDSEGQAGYKNQAMRIGEQVAKTVALKNHLNGVATPEYETDKYISPGLSSKRESYRKDDIKKNTDIGAAHAVMQSKMKSEPTLRDGLRGWRGKNKEPVYPEHVIAIARQVK